MNLLLLKMVQNYDCRTSYIECGVENRFYELELAQISINTANNVEIRDKDYDNAFEILMRALLCIGNAVLIYKYKLKSKSKGCQFQYLFNVGLISEKQIKLIDYWFQWRNNLYYNNQNIKFPDMDKKIYQKEKKKVLKLIEELKLNF